MHVQLQITATFETPFHVGSGTTGEGAVLKPVLKDEQGRPYVPGSAWKGVLRHEAERIVRALAGQDAVCRAPRAETMCPQAPRFGEFCPVCRAFGSPAYPSPFQFSDLRADVADADALSATTLRYGVGVSRYRGAAAEDLLYTTEVAEVAPLVPLMGTIEGNVPDAEGRGPTALILAALGAIRSVGAGRSRGLGWMGVRVSDAPLTPAEVREELRRWLPIKD